MKHFTICVAALLCGLMSLVSAPEAQAADALAKYKLDLRDTSVCKVYYSRGGKWQAADSLVVGKKSDGVSDSIHAPYPDIKYAIDGEFVDQRTLDSAQIGGNATNFYGANQGFLVFDFGEKGIDLMQVKIYNDGYYKSKNNEWGNHQNGTVFAGVYGDCSKATYTDKDLMAGGLNPNNFKIDFLRTNGSNQKFSTIVTNNNHWVTGSVDKTANEPGDYTTTVTAGNHCKYRYVMVFDWSYGFYLSEVELWGVVLKNVQYTDAQLDLDRAITAAESYATEFRQSNKDAVDALKSVITDAKSLLANPQAEETALKSMIATLNTATDTFMAAITYQLAENDFYCTLATSDGMYGVKLAAEKSTVGSYSGYMLTICDPTEAFAFSINKSSVVNAQQSYQFSSEKGVVIQTGDKLMLVSADQVTSSNPAKFVFSQRYYDDGDALYDLKAGNYFYFVEEGELKATAKFPEYESYEEIIPYLFQLTPSKYEKKEEEAKVNFKGWEFNDPAQEITAVYGDKFGQNAGKIMDGWRFNKWRSYTRLEQNTVSTNGYMVASVNNPYWSADDTLKQTPLTPLIDDKSILTGQNNGAGLCRENGKYASQASRDPIDNVRDSSFLIIVNPIYCPFIAIKMAGTSDSVSLENFSLSFYIKKNGVEPKLTMSNRAGKKGDVYYWKLTDCGFTVGQVGYCAQYMGIGSAFPTTKDALVFDWIRPFETVESIPEETIPAADLAAIVETLPESPKYEAPKVGPKTIKYLTNLLTMVTAANLDVTEQNKANLAAACDGDTLTKVAHGNYYVINLPEAIQDFYGLKVYVKGGENEYATNVLFYTDSPLDVTKDVAGNYVPNGGNLWNHKAFEGTVTKGTNCVTFLNPDRKKYTYIAVKGDNDGNPISMTEMVLQYYEDAQFTETLGSKTIKHIDRLMSVVTKENQDVTEQNKANLALCCDGDTTSTVTHITDTYYVIKLPEGIKDFYSLKINYQGGNNYSTNVFFYNTDSLNLSDKSEKASAYVPNCTSIWQRAAMFDGTVQQGTGSVTFTNTKRDKYTYIAIKGDGANNHLSMTEVQLQYYADAPYSEPLEGKTVKYPARLMTMVTNQNEDVTEENKSNIALLFDGDTQTAVTHITDFYYVINLPEAIQDFYSIKLNYNGGNNYSTNVFFYNTETLDLSNKSEVASSYVPDCSGVYNRGKLFDGKIVKENGAVTFLNTNRTKFTYIAIKGDGANNPLSMTELAIQYYEDAKFVEKEDLQGVNFWTISTNWTSTRTNGSTSVTQEGYLQANAGTDNAKRADIVNKIDKFYMQDHKVVFYTAEPTNIDATQNYGDMKFTYWATVSGFNPDTAVVNEQVVRKNTNQQYMLADGTQLVFFDLSTTNANKAYYEGQSTNAFTSAQKDAYKKALIAENDLEIKNAAFVLIASAASNFILRSMGSAKDVATLVKHFIPEGLEDVVKEAEDGIIYDIFGRQVKSMDAPGLYIMNGKKYLVK